ncbi:hypothetical protein M501DRAFT_314103 [Patellaria atrata CBS 101060]|uniref:protein S-acyltransferase n=1 Tax=Patellaria atrata CBS 101060 TaxID=1346257 RepID=A0A9P4S4E3_9PEZI|nr:hypothetical protein M501DRAFT_314103 [Patellaria atrata CBS 101060]
MKHMTKSSSRTEFLVVVAKKSGQSELDSGIGLDALHKLLIPCEDPQFLKEELLHRSILLGRTEIVKVLLEYNIPLDKAPWSVTTLHVAASVGNVELVRLIFSKIPTSIFERHDLYQPHTPVGVACNLGRREVVRMLLELGQSSETALPAKLL